MKTRFALKECLGVFLRGIAMGVAEIIPGRPAATIVFVSGICDELVDFLAGLSRGPLLKLLTSPVGYWRDQHENFLCVFVVGTILAILSCARLLTHVLDLVLLPVIAAGRRGAGLLLFTRALA